MIDYPTNVKTINVKVGHVEIVENETFTPSKLLKYHTTMNYFTLRMRTLITKSYI